MSMFFSGSTTEKQEEPTPDKMTDRDDDHVNKTRGSDAGVPSEDADSADTETREQERILREQLKIESAKAARRATNLGGGEEESKTSDPAYDDNVPDTPMATGTVAQISKRIPKRRYVLSLVTSSDP